MPAWDEFLKVEGHAGLYRWRTECLRDLLAQPFDPDLPPLVRQRLEDVRGRVGREVSLRSPDRVRRTWGRRHRFPVVFFAENPRDDCDSRGLLFWFGLSEASLGERGDPIRQLQAMPFGEKFRQAVCDGLELAGADGRLVVSMLRGPVLEDAVVQPGAFDGDSVGLAVACFARWFLRGVWPDRPVVISGALDGGLVRRVEGIRQKYDGAAERGVRHLIVPCGPEGPELHGRRPHLLGVPEGGRFEDWLRGCEAALSVEGIALADDRADLGRTGAPDVPATWVDARLARDRAACAELRRRLLRRRRRLGRRLQVVAREAAALPGGSSPSSAEQMLDWMRRCTSDRLLARAARRFGQLHVDNAELWDLLHERLRRRHECHPGAAPDPFLLYACASARPRRDAEDRKAWLEGAIRGLRDHLSAHPEDGDVPEVLGFLLDAHATLGGWLLHRKDRAAARQEYQAAHEIDPTASYPLGNLVELDIADAARRPSAREDVAAVLRPWARKMARAAAGAGERALAGENLPWAWFDAGKLRWLSRFAAGAPPSAASEAVAAYARGASICAREQDVISALKTFGFDAESRTFGRGRLGVVREASPEGRWIAAMLRLVLELRFEPHAAAAGGGGGGRPRAIVIAGRCNGPASDAERRVVLGLLDGFDGLVVSGGTTAGVSGLVGEARSRDPGLRAVGCRPERLPAGDEVDARYAEAPWLTDASAHSPAEPLRYWSELRDRGVRPGEVRFVAIGGGTLTAFELQLALALHAPALFVRADERVADATARGLAWRDHPLLERVRIEWAAARPSEIRRRLGLSPP